jgi:glycosyltransferase involved in cell wall biosynthesis
VHKLIEEVIADLDHLEYQVLNIIERYTKRKEIKILAAGISSMEKSFRICAKLWLAQDITPFRLEWKKGVTTQEQAYYNCLKVDKHFNTQCRTTTSKVAEAASLHCIPSLGFQYEVQVDFNKVVLVRLEDYQVTVTPKLWHQVRALAQQFRRERLVISFISATPQGGGVALMRHALVRFLKLLEVPVHWHVVRPSNRVFHITKRKFHNVLQGVAAPDVRLEQDDKERYTRWCEKNARYMDAMMKLSHVIVIDDPQPAGMIPLIRRVNPTAKIIYRSHIEIRADLTDTPGTQQHDVWNFLWSSIQEADLFISHPVDGFVPKSVPPKKVHYMPATTDPLDGLNKRLSDDDLDFYISNFNAYLQDARQTPLDPNRSYIIQIARFDPSKGLPEVIESYRLLCEKLSAIHVRPPQLVLTGHSSIDDPDKTPILVETLQLINSEKYQHLRNDIKTIALPAKDQLLNALLRRARIALQLSIREGFEVKVTEAIQKGVPIIAYRTGGIPLQINDGVNGFLVDVGDRERVAQLMFDLLTKEELYNRISATSRETVNEEFFTVASARNWLYMALNLAMGRMENLPGNFKQVKDVIPAQIPLEFSTESMPGRHFMQIIPTDF